MSKNELQETKREKILGLERALIEIADGENIIGDGKEIVYHDKYKYKHTFADGIYVREMFISKGETVIGAIHKHLHIWILLSGLYMLWKIQYLQMYTKILVIHKI